MLNTTENERPLDTFQLTNYNDTADRGTLVPSNDSFDVDANTNERPLDNFNLYNYNGSTDRGVLGPNKEDQATQLENNIENGNITPEQLPENSPIQKEAEQLTDSNPKNDEVKNDAVEDFLKQMEAAQPTKQEQDEAAYRKQLNDMQLSDDINPNIDNYEMLHFTPEEDKPTDYMWAPGSFMRKDIRDNVNLINSYPTSQKRAALELLARINNGDIDSYEDMLKANPWMDEAMYGAISSIASNDNSGRIPVISKSSIKRNKATMENFIEKHPEEAAETLPEGEAKQEAEQIINDNDKRNDEVNNDKIGKFINSGVDWDNVKVYKPNEDPYSKVTDEYDWKNNPDYEAEPIEVGESKDEDFLGPDEYIDENGNIQVDPNWKPENADEDFVGPDEQLATINDGLPAEVKYEPVYDTDDYNFDWDYAVENVPELRELNDELDAEDKEEIAQLLGFKFGGKPGSLKQPPQDNQATNDIKFNNSNAGLGNVGSGFLGKISSGNVNPSHVGSGVNFNTRMDSVKSIASKAPVPPEAASTSKSKAVAGSNNNLPHSNGTVGSGAGMMFQKRNSDLKIKGSNLPELGGPHHQSEIEETNVDDIVENMSEGLIETLEKMLNEHPELGEQLGFDHKYKHWAFNGISLDELPIDKITSLTNSLRRLV